MRITETLKKINRTLLEMEIGLVFWGVICQIVGSIIIAFTAWSQGMYARSLWFGILLAMAGAVHMYRTLDRALDYSEKDANKAIFRGYLFRYTLVAFVLLLIAKTQVMNPLIVFLAYMGLKVTAFLQPLTHKMCNRIFR